LLSIERSFYSVRGIILKGGIEGVIGGSETLNGITFKTIARLSRFLIILKLKLLAN